MKNVADAAKLADFLMILLPDEVQRTVYKQEIEPNLVDGKFSFLRTGLIFTSDR